MGKPDGRCPLDAGVVHRRPQFCAPGESLGGLKGRELVGRGDLIRVVCGLVDRRGRYAESLAGWFEPVVDATPCCIVGHLVSNEQCRQGPDSPEPCRKSRHVCRLFAELDSQPDRAN